MLAKTIKNFILNTKKSRQIVNKFEIVGLSVSLFRPTFIIFHVSALIFGIMLVMSHASTDGNLLDFLTYKILTELRLDEFRPMGTSISLICRHPPNTSEHPTITPSSGVIFTLTRGLDFV